METMIMDTTNGHDKNLVERINKVWDDDDKWSNIALILSALMVRDKDEIHEKIGAEIFLYDDYDVMVKELGGAYLMQVADNTDLRIILDFVRG